MRLGEAVGLLKSDIITESKLTFPSVSRFSSLLIWSKEDSTLGLGRKTLGGTSAIFFTSAQAHLQFFVLMAHRFDLKLNTAFC